MLHFISVYTTKVKKILRQNNTIFFYLFYKTPRYVQYGQSKVYCIKPEGIISWTGIQRVKAFIKNNINMAKLKYLTSKIGPRLIIFRQNFRDICAFL